MSDWTSGTSLAYQSRFHRRKSAVESKCTVSLRIRLNEIREALAAGGKPNRADGSAGEIALGVLVDHGHDELVAKVARGLPIDRRV